MAIHVVSIGENLGSISSRYHVPIDTIVRVNGLPSNTAIVSGLSLYIPTNTWPIRAYQIKHGDSLNLLTQRFQTSLSLIRTANPEININQVKIGQIINIPSPNKLSIRTLGFLVPSTMSTNLSLLDSLSNQLTYLAIVNYTFTNTGFAFDHGDDSEIISKCKQLNMTPLLMIRNFITSGFSAELAETVLENSTFRQNLIDSIIHLTNSRGFGGVSLDLEFIPPQRRNDFNSFLRELKTRLGSFILHVNVHAKAADLPTNRIVGAYDYLNIGKIADFMAIMTMDYGYPGGPPAPISPYGWVEDVIKYALTQVNRKKLFIALPLYGYDKVVTTNATRGLSVLAAQNEAIAAVIPIQYNNTFKSPWYRYRTDNVDHIVWFEDIRSYVEKYKLIDIYELVGATYWQIGLSAPQNWEFLKKEISIIKNRFPID